MSAPRDFAREVQEAIAAIPHTRQCYTTTLGDLGEVEVKVCICDREQRLAQQVAAAIQAGIRGNKDGLLADGEFCVDCLASAEAAALRALTHETP